MADFTKITDIKDKELEKLNEMIEGGLEADKIIEAFNLKRNALQMYVGRLQQQNQKFYNVPSLYTAPSKSVRDIQWSAKKGVAVGPNWLKRKVGDDAKEVLDFLGNKETSFALEVVVDKKGKNISGITITLTSE